MNYHEMTMNEPRNSPARRQQYLVICTIMAGVFVHAFITSGGISPIIIREHVFPGGDFVYRTSQRYDRDSLYFNGVWCWELGVIVPVCAAV